MSYRIPDEFVQTVLARVDLAEIIGQRLELKKSAQQFMARCPFHTEKTPSFSVNPHKRFFYCFGCHAHGDAIEFVMKYDGVSFVAAVESLAAELGLSLPKTLEDDASLAQEQALSAILSAANHFYQQQLRLHKSAPQAIDYLKARGLTGQIAKAFAVGFAPPAWDAFHEHCLHNKLSIDDAIQVGLLVQKEGGRCYDRFRNRVMFPILNIRGQVIGFGGRSLDQTEPKYLNSSDSLVFNKGSELYGLYQAKAQRNLHQLIVVEGYLDVISLHQFGLTQTCATLGTAVTQKHLELLNRYSQEIIFCFDGDKPGRDAAKRALTLALPSLDGKKRLRFLELSPGSDPDSFIRQQGVDAFKRQIDASISIVDFLFQMICEAEEGATIESRARIVNTAKPLIESVRSTMFQDLLYERLAQIVRLDPSSLKGAHKLASPAAKAHSPRPQTQTPFSPAQRALALLLRQGELAQSQALEPLIELDMPGFDLLYQVLPLLKQDPYLTLSQLMSMVPPVYQAEQALMELSHFASIVPESGVEPEFRAAMTHLNARAAESLVERLLLKAKNGELSPQETETLRTLLRKTDAKT